MLQIGSLLIALTYLEIYWFSKVRHQICLSQCFSTGWVSMANSRNIFGRRAIFL